MSSDNNRMKIEIKKEDLEKLLRRELSSDLKVENFTSKPLTNPGDNYGSTILAVEVVYRRGENNELYKLPIVAKLVSESQYLREMFNIEITFNKEARAYTLVSPEFHKLQKEKGIPEGEMLDVFSKYYGSRSNKQDDINMEADNSAIILMENLKLSGYEVRERRKGLNLNHMEFAIKKIAQFHALGVALKLLKPQVFEEVMLKACEKFLIGKCDNDETIEKSIESTLGFIKAIPECVPYIERIEKSIRDDTKMRKEKKEHPPREPFATILHNDFWVNNMMFKYESNNEGDEAKNREVPTGIKFVDFQVTLYDSPVRDLMFFLFTSSEDGLLDKHFDDLIKVYHSKFIEMLRNIGCDTDPFSYKHFEEEMNVILPREFPHILFLLNPICADSQGMEEHSNITYDTLFEGRGGDVYKKKVSCFVQKYVTSGWL